MPSATAVGTASALATVMSSVIAGNMLSSHGLEKAMAGDPRDEADAPVDLVLCRQCKFTACGWGRSFWDQTTWEFARMDWVGWRRRLTPYVQSATSSCNKLCANTFRAPFVEAAGTENSFRAVSSIEREITDR